MRFTSVRVDIRGTERVRTALIIVVETALLAVVAPVETASIIVKISGSLRTVHVGFQALSLVLDLLRFDHRLLLLVFHQLLVFSKFTE